MSFRYVFPLHNDAERWLEGPPGNFCLGSQRSFESFVMQLVIPQPIFTSQVNKMSIRKQHKVYGNDSGDWNTNSLFLKYH